MPSKKKIQNKRTVDRLLTQAAYDITQTPDPEIPALLGDGILDRFLRAIGPVKEDKNQSIYDYLLHNKNRLALLASLRDAITNNYSIEGTVRDMRCYVSPTVQQWFDNGVMFVQGGERFGGLIGLYQDGAVKFAITQRYIAGGENIGPDDLLFIDAKEAETRANQRSIPRSLSELSKRVEQLECLLTQQEIDEGKYQDYLQVNPWCFGAEYEAIESHLALDDANIPDFTGVRVRDKARDIIEIKQPFLPLFKSSGEFRAEFHAAYDQVERYLDFARTNADYLQRQKGLYFDNPRCHLLAGYNLSADQLRALRRKGRANPAITIVTYNDLVTMAKSTVRFVRMLKAGDEQAEVNAPE
jgi:hypothetical protein